MANVYRYERHGTNNWNSEEKIKIGYPSIPKSELGKNKLVLYNVYNEGDGHLILELYYFNTVDYAIKRAIEEIDYNIPNDNREEVVNDIKNLLLSGSSLWVSTYARKGNGNYIKLITDEDEDDDFTMDIASSISLTTLIEKNYLKYNNTIM